MEKQKRQKLVYTSSQEVFHLWAAQSQEHARQGGNPTRAYFDGTSCYSYGSHYKVGELVKIKGIQVALINRRGYSNTTSKHIGEATFAVSHLPTIEVDDSFNWKQGLLRMQGELIDDLFGILNRRSFYTHEHIFDKYQQDNFTKFNNLCNAVGMQHLKLYPDDKTIELLKHHAQSRIDRDKELVALRQTPEYLAKQEAKRVVEAAKFEAKNRDEIEAWKVGGPFTNAVSRLKPQIIRVVGNEVQTSSRATVTVPEAMQALMYIQNSTLKPGTKIGAFEFNGIENGIVKIGCHDIELKTAVNVLTVRKAG